MDTLNTLTLWPWMSGTEAVRVLLSDLRSLHALISNIQAQTTYACMYVVLISFSFSYMSLLASAYTGHRQALCNPTTNMRTISNSAISRRLSRPGMYCAVPTLAGACVLCLAQKQTRSTAKAEERRRRRLLAARIGREGSPIAPESWRLRDGDGDGDGSCNAELTMQSVVLLVVREGCCCYGMDVHSVCVRYWTPGEDCEGGGGYGRR